MGGHGTHGIVTGGGETYRTDDHRGTFTGRCHDGRARPVPAGAAVRAPGPRARLRRGVPGRKDGAGQGGAPGRAGVPWKGVGRAAATRARVFPAAPATAEGPPVPCSPTPVPGRCWRAGAGADAGLPAAGAVRPRWPGRWNGSRRAGWEAVVLDLGGVTDKDGLFERCSTVPRLPLRSGRNRNASADRLTDPSWWESQRGQLVLVGDRHRLAASDWEVARAVLTAAADC